MASDGGSAKHHRWLFRLITMIKVLVLGSRVSLLGTVTIGLEATRYWVLGKGYHRLGTCSPGTVPNSRCGIRFVCGYENIIEFQSQHRQARHVDPERRTSSRSSSQKFIPRPCRSLMRRDRLCREQAMSGTWIAEFLELRASTGDSAIFRPT